MECVKQIDIYKSPGFPAILCAPLWFKLLNSLPDITDHAEKGAIFKDHYFRRITLVCQREGGHEEHAKCSGVRHFTPAESPDDQRRWLLNKIEPPAE